MPNGSPVSWAISGGRGSGSYASRRWQLTARLVEMARFRNRLVYLYWDTDFRLVHRILREDLDDLEAFARAAEPLL